MELGMKIRRNEILVIFIILSILSSIPNIGHLFDETVCASKPCPTVKLKNPVILPYSWIFPEKKCNYCNLYGSLLSVLYVNKFPLVHVLNLVIDVAFLLMLSILIHYGLQKTRHNLLNHKAASGKGGAASRKSSIPGDRKFNRLAWH